MLVTWLDSSADSFWRQTSMNWGVICQAQRALSATYMYVYTYIHTKHTFPYTSARTAAVSSCSSVHTRDRPAIDSDHICRSVSPAVQLTLAHPSEGEIPPTLNDLRGSRELLVSLGSLYGRPAQCTLRTSPLRSSAMKSCPVIDNGM